MSTRLQYPQLLLPLLLLVTTSLQAAQADPLFRDSDILAITLIGPFSRMDRERDEENDYKGGTLVYLDAGQEVALDVEYELRGNFRLRRDICRHVQVFVEFEEEQVPATLFANQDDLKLAVQCRDRSRYQVYLLRELQAYRLFQTLSDYSFRTRALNVTYRDNERDQSRTQPGFFIEDRERMASRLGMRTVERNSIEVAELDPAQANLVDLFMFMIGNTDYSIIAATDDECCHNTKLLESAGGKYLPVPYDFDSSGYVNARYAKPDARLPIRNVRQRLYRGFCFPEAVVTDNLATFRAQREALLAIAGDTTLVDARTASDSVDYLQAFFAIIDDPESLQDEILDACRR